MRWHLDRNIFPILCTILLVASACARDGFANSQTPPGCGAAGQEVRALRLRTQVAAGEFPPEREWQRPEPVSFCSDWQGKHADPQRATEVRILWSDDVLYLEFRCRYRELYTFEDATPSGRRETLWERDVAEAFVQPDRFGKHFYKEFEVSPNGFWIDLDVFALGDANLHSGMRTITEVNQLQHIWTARVAIPMRSITSHFDPHSTWRANFFRVEGREPNRSYFAWHATRTPQPDFHVPRAFGTLTFIQ